MNIDNAQGELDLKVVSLMIEVVFPEHHQPRGEFDEVYIKSLAESIRLYGQLDPIAVWFDANSSEYLIKHGECRYRAIKQLGLSHIRAIVYPKDAPEISFEAMVANNTYRRDLNDLDLAFAVVKIVADRLQVSNERVKNIFHRYRKNRTVDPVEEAAIQAACSAVRLSASSLGIRYIPLLSLPPQLNWLVRANCITAKVVRLFASVKSEDFQQRLALALNFEVPLTKGRSREITEVLDSFKEEAEKLVQLEAVEPNQEHPVVLRFMEIQKRLRQKYKRLSPETSDKIIDLFAQINQLLP